MINIDKITNNSPSGYAIKKLFHFRHRSSHLKAKVSNRSSCRIPFNHVAFLGIAKLVQAACAHFLKEWIKAEHKLLFVVLWCILAAGSLVLLLIERPWSRPGLNHWKVHQYRRLFFSRKNKERFIIEIMENTDTSPPWGNRLFFFDVLTTVEQDHTFWSSIGRTNVSHAMGSHGSPDVQVPMSDTL
jgi:hypothetical protein